MDEVRLSGPALKVLRYLLSRRRDSIDIERLGERSFLDLRLHNSSRERLVLERGL